MENEKNAEAENLERMDKNAPICCQGCLRWEKFGKQCWYYWENKKHCTMWTSNWNELIG